MLNTKPMASLSPTLLARKGQARPAMRRAGMADLASIATAGDDLGWNDMGEGPTTVSPVLPPMNAPTIAQPVAPAVPAVLEQRRHLVEEFAPVAAVAPETVDTPPLAPEPVVSLPTPVAEPTAAKVAPEPTPADSDTVEQPLAALARRAAFTLRLDADRHLRLRLASAARGRSAQKLVTEALDAFLATMPDVATLHAQLAGTSQPNDRGE